MSSILNSAIFTGYTGSPGNIDCPVWGPVWRPVSGPVWSPVCGQVAVVGGGGGPDRKNLIPYHYIIIK